jgi:hypothetical protein
MNLIREKNGSTVEDVERDLSWSSKLFNEKVWPIIKTHCQGGYILQLETMFNNEIAQYLDRVCGVDAMQVTDWGIRGIACRVQVGDYRSFTIRSNRVNSNKPTEFDKRLFAIKNRDEGWMYPYFTVQAYATSKTGKITSVGIARTRDVIHYIVTQKLQPIKPQNENEFYIVNWDLMQKAGYDVKVITDEGEISELNLPLKVDDE